MAYLLRVELPDVPGSLGALATALGTAGADIEAIEIVEKRPDGRAVDDVLLELPPQVMPDALVTACHRLDDVEVLWISRYAAGSNLRLDLEAVEAITSDPEHAFERLVQVLPETFRCDWALGVRHNDAGWEVFEPSAAAPDPSPRFEQWLGLRHASRLSLDGWDDVVLAGVPLGDQGGTAVFGRRGGPEVLDSELARLSHLAALAWSISAGG